MRNGRNVWYCKRHESEDGVVTFDEPIQFTLALHTLTIQPMSGYMNVVEFGQDIGKMWNCIGQPYDMWENIQEGDRWYVDGAEPEGFETGTEPDEGWGFDANAEVYSVRPQNLAVRFILRRIQ